MILCVSNFIFCLEPKVREQLDENDFRHCYGIFFESMILKLLDQAMFKVFLQQLRDSLTTVFETIHYSWRFCGHGSPYEPIFSWVNIFKRKSVKLPGLSSSLLFEKHSTKTFTISLIIVFSFFSQINLVYKISYFVVPMIFATVYFFFYFLIFCVFWS